MTIPVYGFALKRKNSILKEPVYGGKTTSCKKEVVRFIDFRRVSYSTYPFFLLRIDKIHNLIYKIKHGLSIRDKSGEFILFVFFNN